MALHKKKKDPLGTTRITGKELDKTFELDPEGRFEVITANGYRQIYKVLGGGWYLTALGVDGSFSQKEAEELPEIVYTHSAFLSEEEQ